MSVSCSSTVNDGGISTARIDDQGIFTNLKDGRVNPNWTHITPA